MPFLPDLPQPQLKALFLLPEAGGCGGWTDRVPGSGWEGLGQYGEDTALDSPTPSPKLQETARVGKGGGSFLA